MKGTAMAVVLTTVAAYQDCNIAVPSFAIKKGARLSHFTCYGVSSSCCNGLNDVEQLASNISLQHELGDRGITNILKQDLIGTCGRMDQVNLYNCAVQTIPQLVPAGKEGKARALIQSKGCHNISVSSEREWLHDGDYTDGSGPCNLLVRGGSAAGFHHIDGVSAGCCNSVQTVLDEAHTEGPRPNCHMIGSCGKQDQLSILKFVEAQEKSPAELLLLESYFTLGGSQAMLASFMTSEVENDDAIEDGATEDGSEIMTGLLGFVAGAAVMGLGVTVLRCRSPSQDEYNQIVA